MHLRGPMNISQLAVYQVPNEASKMRKRSTVPFYSRRRALKQRNPSYDIPKIAHLLEKRTWSTSTICNSASTVTSTVTVRSCTSGSSAISTAPPNTTYVGPPLPCLSTLGYQSTTVHPSQTQVASLSAHNCTCESLPMVTQNLERHPKIASRPTSAQFPSPSVDTAHIHKRAADWDRVAYYTSAAPAEATGFSFLANLGDPRQSGTFD
jgi:hypothetical protein